MYVGVAFRRSSSIVLGKQNSSGRFSRAGEVEERASNQNARQYDRELRFYIKFRMILLSVLHFPPLQSNINNETQEWVAVIG